MQLPKFSFSRLRLSFGKYLKAHHISRAGFALACLAAAIAFFVVGAAIRLLIGPISLGPFSNSLADALAEALPGISVKYDQAAVEWSRDEGKVELVILGARVFDADGRIIAQAPKAAIDLSARSIFSGHPEVRRITLIGVQLTLVRTRDGGLRLGIGKDISQQDFLTNITDAITATNSKTSTLQAFAVRDARVAFLDDVTGLFVVSPRTDMTIQTAGPKLEASLDSDIEISGHSARVKADLVLPPKKGPVSGDLTVTGLDVGALGANAPMFAVLKGIALSVDMSASFTIDHGAHLSAADFGIDAHGAIGLPGLIVGPVRVTSAKIVGRYDGDAGRLLIDDASLKSDHASLHLVGSSVLGYDSAHALSSVAFDATGDSMQFIAPGALEQRIVFDRLALRGTYLPATRDIVLDHFGLEGGPFSAEATGKVTLVDNQSAAVEAKGSLAPLQMRDLLHYWPLAAASGARDWISRNMTVGRVGPVSFEAHLPAGALEQSSLPEGALHVAFPLAGADVNYLKGLTHVTNLDGNLLLTGNSFSADIASANIGPLKLSRGRVSIPDLSVHGTPAEIAAHVDGTLPQVLALVDLKPLNYPTKFGIDAADTKGATAMDLSVHLPLIKELTVDQVAIGVKAGVTGFDMALGSRGRLADGNVNFDINNDRLIADGTADIADSRVAINWTEDFKSTTANSTQISAKGTLDDAARAALKINTGQFLKGPVGVDMKLVGRHGHFARADIALDLSPAEVALDLIGIEKPQATAASGQVTALFGPGGSVRSEDIHLTAPAGSLAAQMQFGKDGSLQELSIPAVRFGAANDFSFHLVKLVSLTEVSIRGRSLDGSQIAHEGASGGSGSDNLIDGPFHVSAKLDRLALREGVAVSPISLDLNGDGPRVTSMSLSGTMGRATITGSVTPSAAARRVSFSTDDAGQLARGLFGLTSMHGGKLDIAAVLPTPSDDGQKSSGPDYQGTIALKDATIANQPFVARLLSMASFAGIGNLLQGSGLQVDRVDVPFSSKNGVISVHDAAASGPTIGVTADGYIDRPGDVVALKGSLIPVFGVDFNKVLGAIPLVGNIFVSKKGEGIFGVTYSMRGNAEQPSVTVNPLAMLTPGILRRVFQGKIPNAAQAPTNVAGANGAPQAPAAPPPASPPPKIQ